MASGESADARGKPGHGRRAGGHIESEARRPTGYHGLIPLPRLPRVRASIRSGAILAGRHTAALAALGGRVIALGRLSDLDDILDVTATSEGSADGGPGRGQQEGDVPCVHGSRFAATGQARCPKPTRPRDIRPSRAPLRRWARFFERRGMIAAEAGPCPRSDRPAPARSRLARNPTVEVEVWSTRAPSARPWCLPALAGTREGVSPRRRRHPLRLA